MLVGAIYGGKAMFSLILLGEITKNDGRLLGKGAREGQHILLAESDKLPSGRLKPESSYACAKRLGAVFNERMHIIIKEQVGTFVASLDSRLSARFLYILHQRAAPFLLKRRLIFGSVEGMLCEMRRFHHAWCTELPPQKE